MLLILSVTQLLLMPVLYARSWLATVLANAIYVVALCYYIYITFLGYNALPFVANASSLLMLVAAVLVCYAASIVLNLNATVLFLDHYFREHAKTIQIKEH